MATVDVELDEDGDLPAFCRVISGRDLIAQRVSIRLKTHLGEWILDPFKGLPFLQWMATKPPDAAAIGAVVRREIETTPGVLRVDDFSSAWTPATRSVEVTATIITAEGELEVVVSPLGRLMNRNPTVAIRGGLGRVG